MTDTQETEWIKIYALIKSDTNMPVLLVESFVLYYFWIAYFFKRVCFFFQYVEIIRIKTKAWNNIKITAL